MNLFLEQKPYEALQVLKNFEKSLTKKVKTTTAKSPADEANEENTFSPSDLAKYQQFISIVCNPIPKYLIPPIKLFL